MRGLPDLPQLAQLTPVFYNFREQSLADSCVRRCLQDRRLDETNGVPLGLGSLVLRYLMPVYDLERNVPADTASLQTDIEARLREGLLDGRFGCHVTGSSIERLAVPPYSERGGARPVALFNVSDVDVMIEMKHMEVATRRGAGLLFMDTSKASHAGYTRVVLDAKQQILDHISDLRPLCQRETEDGREVLYLTLDALMTETASRGVELLPASVLVHRQGPAINLQEPTQETQRSTYDVVYDYDMVPALPLKGELPALSAWLERTDGDDVCWPPAAVREDIRTQGRCFLVGAGHASSQRRDLEWRVSFSDPEKRLALCLSPAQRKVYKLIKMMQKCHLQEPAVPKVLVTYHLKTLLFWELEQCKVTEWLEENLFEHTLTLLDRIQSCLEKHFIPGYFMPENNLISAADAEDVSKVLAKVREIRKDPLKYIYDIDDRFRFDFSPPEPLSELHGPFRAAILSGRSDAAAEALVVSLIRHAQSAIHGGLAVTPRCVELMHDAWQALKPESGPHPVHDDWALFAAAAVFTSMQPDESAWVVESLRIAIGQEHRAEPTRQLTEDELEVVTAILGSTTVGHSGNQGGENLIVDMMKNAAQSGQLEQPSSALSVLSFRLAQLELLRDVRNRQEEGIASCPPLVSASSTARLNIGLIDLTLKCKLEQGVPVPEVLAEAMQRVIALTETFSCENTDAGNRQAASNPVRASVLQTIHSLGVPGDMVADALTPVMDQFCAEHQVGPDDSVRLPFETDPRIIGIIPLYMLGTYTHILGNGLSEQEIDNRYTAFFNMIGFFLKHNLYLWACRMTVRMTSLKMTLLDAEAERVVYDLNRAPLYLQQVPRSIQQLIQLTTGRAALGAVYLFIDFVNMMFDRTLMEDFMNVTDDLAKLERLAEAAGVVAADTQLTHRVMALCARLILGRDTTGALAGIAAAAGDEVAARARRIVRQWNQSLYPPPTQQHAVSQG